MNSVQMDTNMDYSKQTRSELILLCKERNLKGYSTKKKEELVTLLTTHPCPTSPPASFTFIDLFCGIGGFHQALQSLGGTCVYACDIDAKCREVYERNYSMAVDSDITKVDAEKLPEFDVLCGGFPCQAFSHAGKQNGFEDTRGTLFRDIVRILKAKTPKYFLLENVKNLKGHDGGHTWTTIKNALREVGYITYDDPLVMSPHILGVPQHRERVLILGWRKDLVATLPPLPLVEKKSSHISSILDTDTNEKTDTMLSEKDIQVLEVWEAFIQYFKSQSVKLPTFPLWTDWWDSNESIS